MSNFDFEQSRFYALERMPYMASALYSFKIIMTERIPARAGITRHGRMLINPEMCKDITTEGMATILLHETMHILSDHFDRGANIVGCEPKRWNYADDLEINDDLMSAGCEIPAGGILLPHQYGFENNLLAEEYYDMLEGKVLPEHSCGSGAGNPMPGEEEFDDGSGLTEEDKERIKNEVAVGMNEHARQGGFVPAGMKRWAEKITQGPLVDWKKQLAKGIKKIISTSRGVMNPTYGRISRRQHNSKDIILPSYSNVVPRIGILLDTSGSMNERDLGDGIFQLKKIFSQMPEIEMWLAVVDAEVYSVSQVKNVRDVEAKIVGGGGTVFTEVFDRLDEKRCSTIVGISDCCASYPDHPPKAKVIWLTSYQVAKPPFGEVITIIRDDEK